MQLGRISAALLILSVGLSACDASRPAPQAPAPRATAAALVAQATAAPAPTNEPAASAAQYRSWMEQARAAHPYPEPVEHMWAVMICESAGEAEVVAGPYHGLFQYHLETWGGTWNPYRDQPILDPRAQIFATAKAWQDGNQSWWGCYERAARATILLPY